MKIVFYSTKPYDKIYFEPMARDYGTEIRFVEMKCEEDTIALAKGYDAICIFVNDYVNAKMMEQLQAMGVRAILLRCAGFNNVDLQAAGKIKIMHVPSYSPEAVAEFAIAMLLTIDRFTHRAYARTREFNMNIDGFMGMNLYGKTVGVIGTGKIGQAMIQILKGFRVKILAYDPYPNASLGVEYVSLEELAGKSDVITLHCPLTLDTKYIINRDLIEKMKQGVYLINTSRGALIDTEGLIDGLLNKKFAGVGLDVYEEEGGFFYEDNSNEIIQDEQLVRLTAFPNVLLTSHMGFFTKEAMQEIAKVTLENAYELETGKRLSNEVTLA